MLQRRYLGTCLGTCFGRSSVDAMSRGRGMRQAQWAVKAPQAAGTSRTAAQQARTALAHSSWRRCSSCQAVVLSIVRHPPSDSWDTIYIRMRGSERQKHGPWLAAPPSQRGPRPRRPVQPAQLRPPGKLGAPLANCSWKPMVAMLELFLTQIESYKVIDGLPQLAKCFQLVLLMLTRVRWPVGIFNSNFAISNH